MREADPADVATEVDGMKFVSLRKLVELKLASGQAAHRLGDLNDVQPIIQALNLPREFANELAPSVRESFYDRWDAAQ